MRVIASAMHCGNAAAYWRWLQVRRLRLLPPGSGAAAFTETAVNAPKAAGAQIQVAGTHSVPGAEVTFLVAAGGSDVSDSGLAGDSASAAGAFEINILLPADIAAGTYYVKVGGQGRCFAGGTVL